MLKEPLVELKPLLELPVVPTIPEIASGSEEELSLNDLHERPDSVVPGGEI